SGTYCLMAEGESPERPSPVVRVTATLSMVTVSLAWTLKVPVMKLLIVKVQVATFPLMPTKVGPVTIAGVPLAPGKVTIGVAKVGVPVAAGKAVTVIVKVSASPTRLTGVSGLMLMLASTTFCGSATVGLMILGVTRSPL